MDPTADAPQEVIGELEGWLTTYGVSLDKTGAGTSEFFTGKKVSIAEILALAGIHPRRFIDAEKLVPVDRQVQVQEALDDAFVQKASTRTARLNRVLRNCYPQLIEKPGVAKSEPAAAIQRPKDFPYLQPPDDFM